MHREASLAIVDFIKPGTTRSAGVEASVLRGVEARVLEQVAQRGEASARDCGGCAPSPPTAVSLAVILSTSPVNRGLGVRGS